MQPEVDTWICPHCGSKNNVTPETWMGIMNKSRSVCCHECSRRVDNVQGFISPVQGDKTGNNQKFNITFFLVSALLLCLIIYLNRIFNIFSIEKDWGQLAYEIVLVLVVSSALASGKIRKNFKYLAIWGGIFIVFLTGYSYRFELAGIRDRIMIELIPSKGIQEKPGAISFPVSSDGHFYIRAEVNGVPVIFLADTGASDIVLSPHDAARLGINLNDLHYDRFYETANGNVRGSSIQIDDLKISALHLKNIRASVNEAEMRNSLLGMTFFKRLKGYEVKNDLLTLYWEKGNS